MVCTKQFCSYRDRAEDFASLNATVVGISSQSLSSHEEFKAKHGLNVPLLADEDKAVAKAYSAIMPGVGSTARAVIVIDEQGIVRHRHDHRLGLDYQTVGRAARRTRATARRDRVSRRAARRRPWSPSENL